MRIRYAIILILFVALVTQLTWVDSTVLYKESVAHTEPVNTVQFSPSGEFLASGADDNLTVIWDRESTEIVRIVEFDSPVNDLEWRGDGDALAVLTHNRTVTILDQDFEVNWTTEIGDMITSLVWMGDDLVVGTVGGEVIRLGKMARETLVSTTFVINDLELAGSKLLVAPDNASLLTYQDGEIRSYSLEFPARDIDVVSNRLFIPQNTSILVLDTSNMSKVGEFGTDLTTAIEILAVSHGSPFLAAASARELEIMNSTDFGPIFLFPETTGTTALDWYENLLAETEHPFTEIFAYEMNGTGIEDIVTYISETYIDDTNRLSFPVMTLLVLPFLSRRLFLRLKQNRDSSSN